VAPIYLEVYGVSSPSEVWGVTTAQTEFGDATDRNHNSLNTQ